MVQHAETQQADGSCDDKGTSHDKSMWMTVSGRRVEVAMLLNTRKNTKPSDPAMAGEWCVRAFSSLMHGHLQRAMSPTCRVALPCATCHQLVLLLMLAGGDTPLGHRHGLVQISNKE